MQDKSFDFFCIMVIIMASSHIMVIKNSPPLSLSPKEHSLITSALDLNTLDKFNAIIIIIIIIMMMMMMMMMMMTMMQQLQLLYRPNA